MFRGDASVAVADIAARRGGTFRIVRDAMHRNADTTHRNTAEQEASLLTRRSENSALLLTQRQGCVRGLPFSGEWLWCVSRGLKHDAHCGRSGALGVRPRVFGAQGNFHDDPGIFLRTSALGWGGGLAQWLHDRVLQRRQMRP